jgi:hypothetical protein
MVSNSLLWVTGIVLLVKGARGLHSESHSNVIRVRLVNENEDKVVSLLEELKLFANIMCDSDVLFTVEYSEMSNSFLQGARCCICYQKILICIA